MNKEHDEEVVGVEISKDIMNLWIKMFEDTYSKAEHLELEKKYKEQAKCYEGIARSYQKKVAQYKELQELAQRLAQMHEKQAQT